MERKAKRSKKRETKVSVSTSKSKPKSAKKPKKDKTEKKESHPSLQRKLNPLQLLPNLQRLHPSRQETRKFSPRVRVLHRCILKSFREILKNDKMFEDRLQPSSSRMTAVPLVMA